MNRTGGVGLTTGSRGTMGWAVGIARDVVVGAYCDSARGVAMAGVVSWSAPPPPPRKTATPTGKPMIAPQTPTPNIQPRTVFRRGDFCLIGEFNSVRVRPTGTGAP